jgi:hypothetical protein
MCLLCNLGTTVICPPISLERILQVLSGEDRKSMSGDCFSVLATLILHMFDLALHAYLMMLFPYSMFLFFIFFKKKKIRGENARNFIFLFLAQQILLVFLPNISVYCALINFA